MYDNNSAHILHPMRMNETNLLKADFWRIYMYYSKSCTVTISEVPKNPMYCSTCKLGKCKGKKHFFTDML